MEQLQYGDGVLQNPVSLQLASLGNLWENTYKIRIVNPPLVIIYNMYAIMMMSFLKLLYIIN